jgi:signal transduction histidine kinase
VSVTYSWRFLSPGQHVFCAFFGDLRHLKRLEHQLADLSEQERQRVGRELHDSLGQEITAVGMLASSLHSRLGNSPEGALAAKVEANVGRVRQHLRTLMKGLFPVAVDAQGLKVALEELARETATVYRMQCRLDCPKDVALENNFTATQLYLIACEAVHNAARHSGASEIVIRLERSDRLMMTVHDNGRGIPAGKSATGNGKSSGLGLRIMQHRAGLVGASFKLESSAENGTQICCSL